MTNFEEWRKAYYEVSMGNGPIVYCDDWTEEPAKIWHSYMVIPQEPCSLCGQMGWHYAACTETYDD